MWYCLSELGLATFVFLFFVVVVGTGVWAQDFTLVKHVFYCSRHAPSPFCFGYSGDGVSRFTQASLDCDPPNLQALAFFSCWEDSHKLFSPGWPGVMILLISASQVVRITGMRHQWLAIFCLRNLEIILSKNKRIATSFIRILTKIQTSQP
jgi:hypothetical protein